MGLMPGTTYSPLPLPQVWTPAEINFFDVSDDFEQKKLYKRFLDLKIWK